MGDRASISFKKDNWESVTFFSHWDGKSLFKAAKKYVVELKAERDPRGGMPLDRLDPPTVMLDFIRWYFNEEMGIGMRVEGNYYLGVDHNDGDNSDNGHKVIKL